MKQTRVAYNTETKVKKDRLALTALSKSESATEDIDELLESLQSQKSESKWLDWKLHPPTGSTVSKSDKFRLIKAIASFANSDGGFIVCGVNDKGQWEGLQSSEVETFDSAHLSNSLNQHIAPSIAHQSLLIESYGKLFIIIHVF